MAKLGAFWFTNCVFAKP